jgi:hypothetical protein
MNVLPIDPKYLHTIRYRFNGTMEMQRWNPLLYKNPRMYTDGTLAMTGTLSNETYTCQRGDWFLVPEDDNNA